MALSLLLHTLDQRIRCGELALLYTRIHPGNRRAGGGCLEIRRHAVKPCLSRILELRMSEGIKPVFEDAFHDTLAHDFRRNTGRDRRVGSGDGVVLNGVVVRRRSR